MPVRKRPNLTPKQRTAVTLLLDGNSQTRVAEAVGVSTKQVWRWVHEFPQFADALERESRAISRHATQRLRSMTRYATATLMRGMRGDATAVQVRSALGVLAESRAVDLQELERRIEALESARG